MRRHDPLDWRVCIIAAVYPEKMGFILYQVEGCIHLVSQRIIAAARK